jgi:hypothetical protein
MMRYFVIALLLVGMGFAATLEPLDMDIDYICNNSVVTVLVTVTSDGDEINGSYVRVEDVSPMKMITSGFTGMDGQFSFEACGDTYNIRASAGGYESVEVNETLKSCNFCASQPQPEPEEEEEEEAEPEEPEETPEPEEETAEPEEEEETGTVVPQPYEGPEDEAEEEPEEAPQKKPCPCVPAALILILLLLVVRSKR